MAGMMHVLISPSWWFGLIITMLMIRVLFVAQDWDLMARHFPILVAISIIICGVIHTINEFWTSRTQVHQLVRSIPDDHADIAPKQLRMLRMKYFISVFIFLFGSFLFGFEISIPLFLIFFMRFHRENWTVSIASAIGMWIFTWVFLSHILHISLPYPYFGPFLDSIGL